MKNTNTNAFRSIVFRYLLDSIPDENQLPAMDDKARAQYIWDRFSLEYDYADNRKRFPNKQARVESWLAGLPLHIAFTYCDIITICEQWHECKLSADQADMVCEKWFGFMAFKLMQLWREYGISEESRP